MKPNMYHYLQNLKNGRISFDRPMPTAGCRANIIIIIIIIIITTTTTTTTII